MVLVSVPDSKPTPAWIAFSITHSLLEVLDEVRGRDYRIT